MNEEQNQFNQNNENNLELSKGERHRLKKERRQAEKESQHQERLKEQKKKSNNKLLIILLIVGAVLAGGYFFFSNAEFESIDESQIISRSGIHWHSDLSIYINGEPQTIPANLGLTGRRHATMHTHDTTGEIHIEPSGLVTIDSITVKEFFEIWGEEFNSQCILVNCNGPDGQVKMTVNGQENLEFENYSMRDRDRIEIRFE